MALLADKKNSDLVSESSLHFWGITCLSGKGYAQKVGERFRVTMAVLDPKSAPKDDKIDKTVSLFVKRGETEYLLCVLKHGEIYQVNLNLIFNKRENVVFHVRGHGNVCLSGYQLTESENNALSDEIEFLCPLAEVRTERSPLPESELNTISPKSKKKAKRDKDFVTSEDRKTLKSWNSMSNRKKNGEIKILEFEDEESDESSDEDFSIGEESSESQESEEFDEEELEEELEEEIIKLQTDNEELEGDQEVVDLESAGPSGSRKRKLEKKSQPKENSFNDEESSDSDEEELSPVETPIPKKTKIEIISEKKSKKKKKLNESNSSEKSVTESTPKSKENTETTPSRNPVQKLEGGIEVQDVIVGKGPVAIKGKMVHVFYVGRFQNKEIFDSRLPGKKPFSFKLGAQQVIKGWDIGLQGMKVGGKRKLKIPPSMGYGSSRIDDIPPNSTLFFLVELQAVS